MDFKLEFNCDNEAFWAPELETRDILNKVAENIENGRVEGTIMDHNGNKVGSWEFTS